MILPALATPSILTSTGVSTNGSTAQGGESAGNFDGTLAALLDGVAPPPPAPSAMLSDIAGRQPIAAPGKRLPGMDMPVETVKGVLPAEAAPVEAPPGSPPIWSPQTVAAAAPMASPPPVVATPPARADAALAAPAPAAATDAPEPSSTPAQSSPAKLIAAGVIATSLIQGSSTAKALVGTLDDAVPVPVPVPTTAVAKPAVTPDRLVRAPRGNDRSAPMKPAVARDDTPDEPDTETDTPAAPMPPVALQSAALPVPIDPAVAPAALPPAPAIVEETAGSAPPVQALSVATPQQLPASPPPRIASDVTRARTLGEQAGETPLASPLPAPRSATVTTLAPVPTTDVAATRMPTGPTVSAPEIRDLPATATPQIAVARATDRPREMGPVVPRAIPARVDMRAPAAPFESGPGVLTIAEPAGQLRVQAAAPATVPTELLAQALAPSPTLALTAVAADALPPRWSAQEAPAVMTLVAQQAAPATQPLPGTVASAGQVFGAAIQAAARGRDEPAGPIDTAGNTAGLGAPAAAVAIHAVVPTADAQAPLDMRQDRWPSAMIERIDMLRDAANASDTRIRLFPDALGAIDVSIRRDGDTVQVHFAAEQAATRTLLQDAQPRLTELADARGLKLSQSSVDTGASANSSQQQQQRAATPQQSQAPAPVRTRAGVAADTDSTDTRLA